MTDFERILLECRYLLSLNKSYSDLATIFHKDLGTIYNDLTVKLPKLDINLYKRVSNVLKQKK